MRRRHFKSWLLLMAILAIVIWLGILFVAIPLIVSAIEYAAKWWGI